MLERINVLKIDPVFTEIFFKSGNERLLHVSFEYPQPKSPAELKTFLESEDGAKLKKVFSDTVDKIALWGYTNSINVSALDRFKKNYIDYSATDNELNKKYIVF